MNPFDNVDYWYINEIPKGWAIGQRVGAAKAMRGVGIQSNVAPELKTRLRPIVPTLYDEEGEPTQAATEWLLAGDLSNVTRAQVVNAIASELGVNPIAVDAKIQITKYDQAGALQFLAANPIWDSP